MYVFTCIFIERERENDGNEFVRGKKINHGLWFHTYREATLCKFMYDIICH